MVKRQAYLASLVQTRTELHYRGRAGLPRGSKWPRRAEDAQRNAAVALHVQPDSAFVN